MPEPYGTLEKAGAYHAAMGNIAWAAGAASPDTAREGALLRASVWIDATYRSRFPGKKAGGRSQEREWPRTGAVDSNDDEIDPEEVPVEIERAAYEAALRELAAPGSLSPDVLGTQRVLREKVGDLEVQYADAGTLADAVPIITAIDGIIAAVLVEPVGNTTSGFLVRA